jgi:hypothetical protein
MELPFDIVVTTVNNKAFQNVIGYTGPACAHLSLDNLIKWRKKN